MKSTKITYINQAHGARSLKKTITNAQKYMVACKLMILKFCSFLSKAISDSINPDPSTQNGAQSLRNKLFRLEQLDGWLHLGLLLHVCPPAVHIHD